MEQSQKNKFMKELVLTLIYLCSWEEKDTITRRAWKGYNFDLLDELKEEDLIDFSYKAKSLYLTPEGIEKAKELLQRFEADFIEKP
jgi:hypothetical protein